MTNLTGVLLFIAFLMVGFHALNLTHDNANLTDSLNRSVICIDELRYVNDSLMNEQVDHINKCKIINAKLK